MERIHSLYEDAREELSRTALEEESMVPDARSELTPSEMVESKLESMLPQSAVMVSHLQRAAARRPVGV